MISIKGLAHGTLSLRYREDSLSEQHTVLSFREVALLWLWGKSPNPAAESASCDRYSLPLDPATSVACEEAVVAEHSGASGWCNVEAKLCEWQSSTANSTELTLSVSPTLFLVFV